MQELKENK